MSGYMDGIDGMSRNSSEEMNEMKYIYIALAGMNFVALNQF